MKTTSWILFCATCVACAQAGGGGGGTPDAFYVPPQPDARTFAQPDAFVIPPTPDARPLPPLPDAAPAGDVDARPINVPDANTTATADATAATADATAACTAPSSYDETTLDSPAAYSSLDDNNDKYDIQEIIGGLTTTATPDLLDIQLYAGSGSLSGGLAKNTTYTVDSDDMDYSTCGLCILIYTGTSTDGSGDPTETATFMATGGSVKFSSLGSQSTGKGTITGTLTGATFQQVTIDPMSLETTVVGSCTTAVPGPITFTSPTLVCDDTGENCM